MSAGARAQPARNIVAIDTSGSFCSVAVANSSCKVVVGSSSGSGDHFEQLPLIVNRVCSEAGITPQSLQEVRIGVGPGSFTGLRIGMSFAKGLAWSLRIPLVGCSSFAGAAAAAMERDSAIGRVVVVADARRDEVFAAAYCRGAGVVEELAPQIVSISELMTSPWEGISEGGCWVSPQRDFAISTHILAPEAEIARGLLMIPGVSTAEFRVEEISMLEPTYLRAVAAKTIEERKQGA